MSAGRGSKRCLSNSSEIVCSVSLVVILPRLFSRFRTTRKELRIMMKRIGGVLTVVLGLIAVAHALPPDQPFMEAARNDLQRARAELQLATRDKGGHRGK